MERKTDMTFLNSFTGGNPDKIKKYVTMFITLCPGQLEQMKGHLDSQNFDGLRATAHALKPQITYMGIKEGENLIKTIEHLAATKSDIEKLPEMLGNFKVICERAMEELKADIN
jgi:HPt (histidine-containing phosphotransfer) domain-containing protein